VLVACVTCNVVLRISLSAPTYSVGDELLVDWTLENQGDIPLVLLKWGTPMEQAWNTDIFSLVAASTLQQPAEYQGRIMKRATPSASDYFVLAAGQSESGQMVLSEGYKFYSAGEYLIRMVIHPREESGLRFSTESNEVSLIVQQPDQHIVYSNVAGARVGFVGCTTSETNTANTAITNAVSASANAKKYMAQTTPPKCTSTFVQWFGTYSSSHWSTINTDFQKINSQLASGSFNIDCTCNQPGVYAYVYPTDTRTHTIYLCPVFWSSTADPYKYNSQPGTLSHEMSHFNDIAATQDYQYGVSGCLEFAKSNPNQAVKNADSHEYFQESKPTC